MTANNLELDVIELPREAGQRVPRHILSPGVVAANCPWCSRLVMRWSLMGEHERRLYAGGIRAAMAVSRIRVQGIYDRIRDHVQRGSRMIPEAIRDQVPPDLDVNDAKAVSQWLTKQRNVS